MIPFVHHPATTLRNIFMSAFLLAVMITVVVWSVLLNATDIVAGLMDHTGVTPTRRQ